MNNIIHGPTLKYENGAPNLGSFILKSLKSHSNNILLVDAVTNEQLSANLFVNQAIRLAKWFRSQKITEGTCVSMCTENRLEFFVVTVATFFVGATFSPISPYNTENELKALLLLTKPKIIFCSQMSIEKLLSTLWMQPYIETVVSFGNENDKINHPKVVLFNDIVQIGGTDTSDNGFTPVVVNPENAIATILYSSGTSGLPKGVLCTYGNLMWFIHSFSPALDDMDTMMHKHGRVVGLAPFFHGMGFVGTFLNILRGKTTIVLSKFNPELFLQTLEKHKIKRITVPPPVVAFLCKHPMASNYDLLNLKVVCVGTATVKKTWEEALKNRFPSVTHVYSAYGLTEATMAVTYQPLRKIKSGSVGPLLPNIKCKVINENGEALGPNQAGELCMKGPFITKGYIGNPTATKEAFDSDGWLHTGDVGYYDDDKYFYIVERKKELIKYKGFQVAPLELEDLLSQHPSVADVAVVGLPDDEAGELPSAFVVRKPGVKINGKDLEDYVAKNVSYHKKLRGGVYFVETIPKTTNGKILRRNLRELAKEMVKDTNSKL